MNILTCIDLEQIGIWDTRNCCLECHTNEQTLCMGIDKYYWCYYPEKIENAINMLEICHKAYNYFLGELDNPFNEPTYYNNIVRPRILAKKEAEKIVAFRDLIHPGTEVDFIAGVIGLESYLVFDNWNILPEDERRWIARKALSSSEGVGNE